MSLASKNRPSGRFLLAFVDDLGLYFVRSHKHDLESDATGIALNDMPDSKILIRGQVNWIFAFRTDALHVHITTE